tara:strand:+ start:642 stop:989 length:348 start_codon:yes stop_codon:yes gene_type:complete
MENNESNENIKITQKAATRIKAILEAENKLGYALRLSVVGGGCSGMNYNIAFDNKKGEFDKVYESLGVNIYCDLQSWLYLKGTTIDFSDDILSGGFKLENPNAARTCGCGTSFSV